VLPTAPEFLIRLGAALVCYIAHAQALTAATASATEHSGRAEVEHARLAELEALLEAKHKELEEAQVGAFVFTSVDQDSL
jgi:hypothetical protein